MVEPNSSIFGDPIRPHTDAQDRSAKITQIPRVPLWEKEAGADKIWTISGFSRAMGPVGFILCIGFAVWFVASRV